MSYTLFSFCCALVMISNIFFRFWCNVGEINHYVCVFICTSVADVVLLSDLWLINSLRQGRKTATPAG